VRQQRRQHLFRPRLVVAPRRLGQGDGLRQRARLTRQHALDQLLVFDSEQRLAGAIVVHI
jgi:hypothetical protein